MLGVLMMLSSLSIEKQVSADLGTGIGIYVQGPTSACITGTINYSITVYNLGDFWVRNLTVTDVFQNGVSSSWKMPDLAPKGQIGDSVNILGILYTVRTVDFPHVINHAEATGYCYVQLIGLYVYAEANCLTYTGSPPRGGSSVATRTLVSSHPINMHITLFLIVLAVFYWRIFMKQPCLIRLQIY